MLENLALRQQLAVLKRKHPRPRLGAFDKLFWVVVRHFWSDWEKSLLLVLPERVARWHQAGFKRYWTMLCKVQKRVGGGGENLRFSGTYTIGDDVTWARGRHTFKFGVETRDAYSNSTNDFLSRPTVDFNNFANFGGVTAFVTGNPQVASNPTLQDMVWSLFGTVGSVTQAQVFGKGGNRTASDLRGFRQQDFDAFAQDTFKILPNLTLNYGLRYQFNGVPYEVNILLSTLLPTQRASTVYLRDRWAERTRSAASLQQ